MGFPNAFLGSDHQRISKTWPQPGDAQDALKIMSRQRTELLKARRDFRSHRSSWSSWDPQNCHEMEVSIVMGVPQQLVGLLNMGKSDKNGWFGGTPIVGNPQMGPISFACFGENHRNWLRVSTDDSSGSLDSEADKNCSGATSSGKRCWEAAVLDPVGTQQEQFSWDQTRPKTSKNWGC